MFAISCRKYWVNGSSRAKAKRSIMKDPCSPCMSPRCWTFGQRKTSANEFGYAPRADLLHSLHNPKKDPIFFGASSDMCWIGSIFCRWLWVKLRKLVQRHGWKKLSIDSRVCSPINQKSMKPLTHLVYQHCVDMMTSASALELKLLITICWLLSDRLKIEALVYIHARETCNGDCLKMRS